MRMHDPQAREAVARVCRTLHVTPTERHRLAGELECSERTLRRDARRLEADRPVLQARGRRPAPVAQPVRQGLIGRMLQLGPQVGVEVLRALFSIVPHRTIAKMKQRLWKAVRRRHGWYRRRLEWTRPGTVWATDFTVPEAALEPPCDRLCLVRDLASGAQLAAVACKGECAATVCAVLAALFAVFGAPLVLKHDGGGAFRAHQTQRLLAAHGVTALCSPPYTPSYNGSCERAGGCLKQRIAYAALVAGRPAHWTAADITSALAQANELARPHGATRPTPGEVFRQRGPIRPSERAAFARTRARARARLLATHSSSRGTIPTCAERAAIDRAATQQALCEMGYLKFRRGRLSTVISIWRADNKA